MIRQEKISKNAKTSLFQRVRYWIDFCVFCLLSKPIVGDLNKVFVCFAFFAVITIHW